MANRILKDWTQSEKVNSISINAEVFFTRLIMKADDFGSFHGNPKLLKANLYPLRLDAVRDADISRWTTECEKAGLILIYTAFDKQYLRIIDFGQRLRSMRSKFPEPVSNVRTTVSNSPLEVEEKLEEEVETEVEEESECGITPQTKTQDQIDFEKFVGWISENTPNIAKLSSPFSLEEFLRIKKEFPGEAVKNILQQMQNKKDLLKKYTSAYLTALNWLKRAQDDKLTAVSIKAGKVDSILDSAQKQLEKRGLI